MNGEPLWIYLVGAQNISEGRIKMKQWKRVDTVILVIVWAALLLAATVTIIFVGGVAPRLDDIRDRLPPQATSVQTGPKAFDYIAFDPFVMEGQRPGSSVLREQIEKLVDGVSEHAEGIRVYGLLDAAYAVEYAHAKGLLTVAGIWLSSDTAANGAEMERARELLNKGAVDILCVGNEALLAGRLTEEQLQNYIAEARQLTQGSSVKIAYADTPENYSAKILAAIDIALPNIHPYWAGIAPADGTESVAREVEKLEERIETLGLQTQVIVGETGFPNPVPGWESFWREYLESDEIAPTVAFMMSDAPWKAIDSGIEIEAHWGLLDCSDQFELTPKPELKKITQEVLAS
jgi:exo-beta-1,3-glucanase (GH17 family)